MSYVTSGAFLSLTAVERLGYLSRERAAQFCACSPGPSGDPNEEEVTGNGGANL